MKPSCTFLGHRVCYIRGADTCLDELMEGLIGEYLYAGLLRFKSVHLLVRRV